MGYINRVVQWVLLLRIIYTLKVEVFSSSTELSMAAKASVYREAIVHGVLGTTQANRKQRELYGFRRTLR